MRRHLEHAKRMPRAKKQASAPDCRLREQIGAKEQNRPL
jgi:hypothetical protein